FLVANIQRLYPLMSYFAPLANRANRSRISRWLLEKVGGIDRRRSLPDVHFQNLRRWFGKQRRLPERFASIRSKSDIPNPRTVLFFDDWFAIFLEPEIGKAAVQILHHAGYDVELTGGVCCGRTLISKGYLPEARELARAAIPVLDRRLQAGMPLLGLEPSCLLTVVDEWPELVPGEAAGRLAAAAELADHWLAQKANEGQIPIRWPRRPGKILLHGHCHQKALRGVAGSAAALRLLGGADVSTLDVGCCGMAGSFGYEKDHFDLSTQIANLELLPALSAEPEAAVVATGTSCRHQIKDLAGRRALHPLQVLAKALSAG